MKFVKRYPTRFPLIPSGIWTKITVIKNRNFFSMWNLDTLYKYRFLVLPSGSDAIEVNEIYKADDGLILSPSPDTDHVGGGVEEGEVISLGDYWVYQDSGYELNTLAVDEGE